MGRQAREDAPCTRRISTRFQTRWGLPRFSVELTDIVAALVAATGCIVAFLRVWSPGEPLLADGDGRFTRPAVAGSSTHDPVMEREIANRDDTTKDRRSRYCAPARPT